MTKTGITILIILILTANIFAQQTAFQDSLLEKMTGKWTLKGIIAGQETSHDVSISWVLAHQYLQINEVSHETDSLGKPTYEALVYIGWDSKLNQYSCLWLDITGGDGLSGIPFGHAEKRGDDIPFLFKISDGSVFHTTFSYNRNEDTWKWLMDYQQNGTMQPFARVVLNRRK